MCQCGRFSAVSFCFHCPPGQEGPRGRSLAFKIEVEPPGANCTYGGEKITVGFDDDYNGVPETLLQYFYLCNVQGSAGNTWTTAAGAPGSPAGYSEGDMYLNSTNGDVYQIQGGVWVFVCNIHGADATEDPIGVIQMFDGDCTLNGTVFGPTGIMNLNPKWALCNGLNGTPDMQGYVPLGFKEGGDGDGDYGVMAAAYGAKKHQLGKTEIPRHVHQKGTLGITINAVGDHRHEVWNEEYTDFADGDNAWRMSSSTSALEGGGGTGTGLAGGHGHTGSVTGATENGAADGLTDTGGGNANGHENRQPSRVLGFIKKIA